jgi:hypothetical protein
MDLSAANTRLLSDAGTATALAPFDRLTKFTLEKLKFLRIRCLVSVEKIGCRAAQIAFVEITSISEIVDKQASKARLLLWAGADRRGHRMRRAFPKSISSSRSNSLECWIFCNGLARSQARQSPSRQGVITLRSDVYFEKRKIAGNGHHI